LAYEISEKMTEKGHSRIVFKSLYDPVGGKKRYLASCSKYRTRKFCVEFNQK